MNIKHFLFVHNDYHTTRVGIFCDFFSPLLIDSIECDNKKISSSLLITIDTLLHNNQLSLKNISFIGCNQGPGPFTTLRVIIASLNGIAYATNLPLIGINCIKTLTYECMDENYEYTIALANAFCNDVYYGIITMASNKYTDGCISCDMLLEHIKSLGNVSIKFVGLVSEEQKNKLREIAPANITLKRSYFECNNSGSSCHVASLEAMGAQAAKHWNAQENVTDQLLPLYFKSSAPIMGTRK